MRILAVYYSQSGQTSRILDAILEPLTASGHDVETSPIRVTRPYPFPFSLRRFFDLLPECIDETGTDIKTDISGEPGSFDLVILAYQVWFLSPSPPITAFLKSTEGKRHLSGQRVITVISCRNMWISAHERVCAHLATLNARLVDGIVRMDRSNSFLTFISTPLWVLTGKKGPFLGGLIPRAGIPDSAITDCQRFGEALRDALPNLTSDDHGPMLKDLGAVQINQRLVLPERIGRQYFRLSSHLVRACGLAGSWRRVPATILQVIGLVLLIVTALPLVIIFSSLLPVISPKTARERRARLTAPSGE